MKTKFIFLLVISCYVQIIYGQENPKTCKFQAEGKSVSISKDKSEVMWFGNVFFDAANINIVGADSIYINNNTNKIIAYNFKSYKFKGQTIVADKKGTFQKLEYTLGNAEVYIK